MSYSEFHENTTPYVLAITTTLREGRAGSPHWRENATVVSLRVLLLAAHLTHILSPSYLPLCCIDIRCSLQAR